MQRPCRAAVLAALLAACAKNGGGAGAPDAAAAPDAEGVADGDHEVRIVTVVRGLEHPWAMAFLPGGDILITERPGRLRLVRGGVLRPAPIAGAPAVVARGQGGLLDLALAPDFAASRLVYLSYAKAVGDGLLTSAVARGRWQDDRLHDLADVLVTEARNGFDPHFGCRLVFDRAGLLFVTVSDRGEMQKAQELSNHHGKVLRIAPDGRPPADNPFVGRAGALPEVFSYGHRNPQGMALHPVTGVPWLNEHGPMGGDEINVVAPGANYGWPLTTYGENYGGGAITPYTEMEGIEPPVLHWTPSIAPSGMAFYTGSRFPRWRGNAFVGALAGTHLRRVALDGTRVVRQQVLLESLGARIRDVRQGPDELLYVLTDDGDGALLRLEPAP